MSDSGRVALTRPELKEALTEQVSLLVAFCERYDAGDLFFAKSMAVALRVCLHHQGRSNALLQQLNLRSGRFYAAAPKPNTRRVPVGCGLVAMSFTPERQGHYVPLLGHLGHSDRLPFPEWWGGLVLRAPSGEVMSRRDIVTAVADMDGGAHVDPRLERTYAAFRAGTLLGMRATPLEDGQIRMVLPILSSGKGEPETEGLLASPQYPSLRTIAHEFLLTMGKYAPWAFRQNYVVKTPPTLTPPTEPRETSEDRRRLIVDVTALFREKTERREEYQRKIGKARIPISTKMPDGSRYIVVGGSIYHQEDGDDTFVRAIHDHALHFFGVSYLEQQESLPLEQRHPALQWMYKIVVESADDKPPPHSGNYASWMRFAYDLFTVRDTGKLQEELRRRLLFGGSFQGARHELRTAAICVAAGFDLQFEDESDSSSTHPEFIGTHPNGCQIAVEAKSRHRHGVQGFQGGRQVAPGVRVDVRGLLLDAYKKDTSLPFYVFVDLNLPPWGEPTEWNRWQNEIDKMMADLTAEGYATPSPANAVFLCNDPSHYFDTISPSAEQGSLWLRHFRADEPRLPHPPEDVVKLLLEGWQTRVTPPEYFFDEVGPVEAALRRGERPNQADQG